MKERAWIESQLDNAAAFVEMFSPKDAGQPLTLAALDRAFAAWIAAQDIGDPALINGIINSVGIAFGKFLVDGFGFDWVIATDVHGSDLAVYGLPGKGDVPVYPANFVAKRWERREANFLVESYQKISNQVQAITHRP